MALGREIRVKMANIFVAVFALAMLIVVVYLVHPLSIPITGQQFQGSQATPTGTLVELLFRDTAGASGDRWARGGMSLTKGSNIVNDQNVQILELDSQSGQYYEVPADIWVQTRRNSQDPSSEFWWVIRYF